MLVSTQNVYCNADCRLTQWQLNGCFSTRLYSQEKQWFITQCQAVASVLNWFVCWIWVDDLLLCTCNVGTTAQMYIFQETLIGQSVIQLNVRWQNRHVRVAVTMFSFIKALNRVPYTLCVQATSHTYSTYTTKLSTIWLHCCFELLFSSCVYWNGYCCWGLLFKMHLGIMA